MSSHRPHSCARHRNPVDARLRGGKGAFQRKDLGWLDSCNKDRNEGELMRSGILNSPNIRRTDLDSKTLEADIVALAGAQQLDRTDAKLFQDLRAEADFQPFVVA